MRAALHQAEEPTRRGVYSLCDLQDGQNISSGGKPVLESLYNSFNLFILDCHACTRGIRGGLMLDKRLTTGGGRMKGKTVKETSVIMAQLMNPSDTNPAGNVHGGVIAKIVDEVGGVVAARHARSTVVTASIGRIDFHFPVFVGDTLFLKASINYAGRTSMEIGVRIEAENMKTGVVRHTASAYLTYVALDQEGKTQEIAPLILETEEEFRRNQEAATRREMRLAEKKLVYSSFCAL